MSKLVAEYKGQTKSLYEWSRITKIDYKTLCRRYENGDRGEDLFRRTTKAICKICGKEFATQSPRANCCSDECKKENARINKKLFDERKKLQPKKKEKKEKKETIDDIQVARRGTGLSYGQYTAMMYLQERGGRAWQQKNT